MATPLLPHSPGLLDLAGVSGYSQRQPTKTVVWQVVQKHWQDYRAETARRHEGIAGISQDLLRTPSPTPAIVTAQSLESPSSDP